MEKNAGKRGGKCTTTPSLPVWRKKSPTESTPSFSGKGVRWTAATEDICKEVVPKLEAVKGVSGAFVACHRSDELNLKGHI